MGVSLMIDEELADDEVTAVRGAAHSQVPSTTRHPMDPVGAGPRDELVEVTEGPNCARAPTERRTIVVRSLIMSKVDEMGTVISAEQA